MNLQCGGIITNKTRPVILDSDILRNGFEQTHRSGIFESSERTEIAGKSYARFTLTARKVANKPIHTLKIDEIVEVKGKAYERLRFYGWVDGPVVLYNIIRAVDYNKI